MRPIQIKNYTITNLNGYSLYQLNTEIPEHDYECLESGLKIPLNYGMGIEITHDNEKYIMKRGGRWGVAEVILKIRTWKGLSFGAIHYYGDLEIKLPEMTRVDKDGYTSSCWDIPMFKNSKIELTQILEQWEIDKYPENFEWRHAGDRHKGFYTVKTLREYAAKVFDQIFEKGWKYRVDQNF